MDLNRVLKKMSNSTYFYCNYVEALVELGKGNMYESRISSIGGVRFADDTDE